MIEVLNALQWFEYTRCRCGGILNIRFSNAGKTGMIKIQPARHKWFAYDKKDGKMIKAGSENELQAYLETL